VLRALTWLCVGAAVAGAQTADAEIAKAFENLMQRAAPAKDADDAARKAAGDVFRAELKTFVATWTPRAGELGLGRRPLARALLLSGRPADAVPHLEDFTKRQTTSPDLEEALMDLGAAYLDVGAPEKARALYETFVAERPKSDLALAARYYLGIALLESGRTDDGLAALEQVAASEADHPLVADARLKIVHETAEVGRVDEARAKLAALLKSAPEGEALLALKADLDRLGTTPPELSGIRTWLNGPATTLAAEKGRVVVLCFFADFYPSSQAELAFLRELAAKYAERPVTVIGLTTYYRGKKQPPDAEDAHLRTFLAEQKATFRVGVAADFSLLKAYGVRGIPHTVVIGKDGKIVHQKTGGSRAEKRSAAALTAALERALK
jgi:cytochrome c biogenesis protein CcmG, thiol:disulfide interchange protein DsbE